MPDLVINRAKPEEAGWAAQLMTATEPWITLGATNEQCLKTFNEPEYHIFVARVSNISAGFIVTHPRGLASSPYIKTISVDKSYRNRGIGTELMGFMENYYRQQSNHLFLCVSSFNTGAQKFYTNLGYKPVGVLEDYVINGQSEIIMYKRLT